MEPDELELKAGVEVELPDTTAYGYGLIISALVEARDQSRGGPRTEAVQELITMLEGNVDHNAQRLANAVMEEAGVNVELPVDPEEV